MIQKTDMPLSTEKDPLDYVDHRIIDLLCNMADAENDSVLRDALTQLATACAEGSLCLPFLPHSPERGTFLANAAKGNYASILGDASQPRPLILHRNRLYFHRHFHAEKAIAEGLLGRLNKTNAAIDAALVESALQKFSAPVTLTPRQKEALVMALREKIFLLSGGPGTGKTTWISSLLHVVFSLGAIPPHRIHLCAPTGRAAQRLQESLSSLPPPLGGQGGSVETLHRLLGYSPRSGQFARHSGDPIPADLVLLDEASMADAFTLAALVRALPADATLILVGDADQLPAVDAGAILSELIGTKIPSVILDRGHRAQQNLIDYAADIRAGDESAVLQKFRLPVPDGNYADAIPHVLKEYGRTTFVERRIRGKTYPEWLIVAKASVEDKILSALMEFIAHERILTCTRHGKFGTVRINRLLREQLRPIFGAKDTGSEEGLHGEPLLITRNDNRTGLSNGEIGIRLNTASGSMVCFPRDGGWLRLPAAFLPPSEPAFAVTVHKSQGSECDSVLLVLPEEGNRVLSREILYTAVTRARKSVRVLGSDAALREALNRRVRRHSGLRDYFGGD
jgi:exodeoxyribonuclease V alpha subunit